MRLGLSMLFLWSREPNAAPASPRAGPWFAWFATAVLLWRCRRRIARVLAGAGSVLQLRLLRRRPRSLPQRTASLVVSKAHHHKHRHRHRRPVEHQHSQHNQHNQHHRRSPPPGDPGAGDAPPDNRRRRSCHQLHSACQIQQQQQQQHIGDRPARVQQPRPKGRGRPKRAHGADGPRRLGASASCVQISQQLYCRVTRSGRVYGRYPTKPPPIK